MFVTHQLVFSPNTISMPLPSLGILDRIHTNFKTRRGPKRSASPIQRGLTLASMPTLTYLTAGASRFGSNMSDLPGPSKQQPPLVWHYAVFSIFREEDCVDILAKLRLENTLRSRFSDVVLASWSDDIRKEDTSLPWHCCGSSMHNLEGPLTPIASAIQPEFAARQSLTLTLAYVSMRWNSRCRLWIKGPRAGA